MIISLPDDLAAMVLVVDLLVTVVFVVFDVVVVITMF